MFSLDTGEGVVSQLIVTDFVDSPWRPLPSLMSGLGGWGVEKVEAVGRAEGGETGTGIKINTIVKYV